MKKYFYKNTMIFIAICIFFISCISVGAQEQKQIQIIKNNEGLLEYTYNLQKDIELRGVLGESKWYFDVDEELEIQNFQFNLFTRLNQFIRKDISYMTIYMNDVPVYSGKLKEKDNELIKNWSIQIPKELIHKGYNELKLRTYSRISDLPCADDKNIANWVVIDKNTNYVMNYSIKEIHNAISDFPKPFIGKYEEESSGIGVIIPNEYTQQEMASALTLIAYMKEYKKGYDVKTTLLRSADAQGTDFESVIYIGNFHDIPENLKYMINNGKNIHTNHANIYRDNLTESKKPVLMIVSDHGESLINAVKSLNNQELKNQMNKRYVSTSPDFPTNIKGIKKDDRIDLKELGINGIEIKGINHQITNIGVHIPFNEVLADKANIHLKMSYSDNIDYEKSMVSIYVNGKPVGSKKLEKEKRELDEITVYIPKELRHSYYYDIQVAFDLIPSGIITCERYLHSVPWAYIKEDSNLFFPKQERSLLLLENLPSPFSKNDDIDTTTIVVGDDPSKEDIETAGKIAEMIGIGVKNNNGIIRMIKGSELKEKYYKDNLILWGTPYHNSAIKEVNKYLWFSYDPAYQRVLSNEKIDLLSDVGKNSTFIELKSSPYNKEKGLMTITSLNETSLIDAMIYFEDDKRGKLIGDAAIISQNGEVTSFRFQKEEKKPILESEPIKNQNLRQYVLFSGAVVILMCSSLILYLYKNKRK
ncbi:cellulose biosynthesis cyclic di-GMP-binding regulatory protein BcsB [Inediibacterium massiliense]|uniref:cellulose biosynthesis cyclic di-GMP-binding regulatory protein BcsB n=1 Tax=Inediibacterium massiliense TaxID=1658111 RepID=UPI0006B41105|nr:cellulose biosynthesis cyclic di-GMP-binding regulatory protein BcsB [Inediibacterium massiliense]